jgi:hypothetical protein
MTSATPAALDRDLIQSVAECSNEERAPPAERPSEG